MINATQSFKRTLSIRMRVAIGLFLTLCLVENIFAVFLTVPRVETPRRLTLQVGSSQFGTVNRVDFNVTSTNVSPNNVPVVGIPAATAATAATTTPNAITFRVTADVPVTNNNWNDLSLTVDSSVGLSCIAGSGCGTTIIPFNTISWTSYNKQTGQYKGFDIQDGVFSGGTTQGLIPTIGVRYGGLFIENELVFTYANSTFYPAGKYTGRVTYTASFL